METDNLKIKITPNKPTWYIAICALIARIGITKPLFNCFDKKVVFEKNKNKEIDYE